MCNSQRLGGTSKHEGQEQPQGDQEAAPGVPTAGHAGRHLRLLFTLGEQNDGN